MQRFLQSLLESEVPDLSQSEQYKWVVQSLVNIWMDDYTAKTPDHEIVEVKSGDFYYLFDIPNERLLAAWGISQGAQNHVRDKARMAGHPMGVAHYHRGHVIPHQLGGGTDINLVTQRGSLNIGAFRVLERKAVATPGAMYFTYWTYGPDKPNGADQLPDAVYQGFLKPGARAEIVWHKN